MRLSAPKAGAQAQRQPRLFRVGERPEHLAHDAHEVASRVRIAEEALRVSIHIRCSGVSRDDVAEICGEDRVLEVAGEDVSPRLARGENSQEIVLSSSVVVTGDEIAALRILRAAPNFAHEPVVHQPSEAGAGGPCGESDDGRDLTGQLAPPV